MAKKRRNTPAKKEQQGGEKVINQLFGSLDDDNDIEGDIAELGVADSTAPQQEISAPAKKNRFFFGFAIFIIVMAIIGCVSTIRFIGSATSQLLDNSSLKNEFTQFIFPVVVNDISPFNSVEEIPNTSKVTCAIWNILIKKDTSAYDPEGTGQLTIPEYDVTASCKEIFGSTVTLQHQSVGTGEVRFTYNEASHSYSAAKNIRYLTYAPQIVEMTEDNGVYRLIVGYLPPALATVTGINNMEVTPDKYMEYTINYWDGKSTLVSVKFANDYSPDTSSGE